VGRKGGQDTERRGWEERVGGALCLTRIGGKVQCSLEED
jgi:hypothetical protein